MNSFSKTVISIIASLKVQKDELGDLREAFLKLDTNQDGGLTVDELENGLGNLSLFELLQDHTDHNEDQYKQIMSSVDLDGDGKIDYAEFI